MTTLRHDYPEYDDGAAHQLLLEQELLESKREKREHKYDCTCFDCVRAWHEAQGSE